MFDRYQNLDQVNREMVIVLAFIWGIVVGAAIAASLGGG